MANGSEALLNSDTNMAEVLRAWDDEEDELVEFIQQPHSEDSHRRRAENGASFQDVLIHEDGRTTIRQPKERSTLTGRPVYLAYTRGFKSAALFITFFGLGMSYAIYGPSLLDLAGHTRSSIQQMSCVFTSRAIGYLLGSLAGGWLFGRYDNFLVLGGAALGGTLGMLVFPLVGSVSALAIIAFIMSLAFGAIDAGGKAQILILWPNKTGLYTQYLHFTFAIGAFFATLLVKPFLLPITTMNTTNNTNTTQVPVPVTWAYWISAIPLGVSGVVFLVFTFLKSCKEPYTKKQDRRLVTSGQNGKIYRVVIITLFFLLLLQYVAMETVYGGFVFTFAVKSKPSMTKDGASLLTASYWGSFAFARLAAVPLSKYCRPPRILLCDFIGSLLGGIVLISQFGESCDVSSNPKLWAGTIILGISLASVFPAIMSWVEYFIDISEGRAASMLLIGSCLGDMVVPVTVGSAFESVGPCTLMYCVFAMSILGMMTFAAIVLFARHYQSFGGNCRAEFHNRNKDELLEAPTPDLHDDEVLKLLEQNNEIFSNGNGEDM